MKKEVLTIASSHLSEKLMQGKLRFFTIIVLRFAGFSYHSLYRAGCVDVDLTNREALTVRCSVVKHAASD